MGNEGERIASNSRRKMLRWLALAGLGGGITLLGLDALLKAPASAVVNPQETLRVKVVYFQMQQSVSVGHEYFELQSPAHVSDLMRVAIQRHPVLSAMVSTMLILVEGIPANGTTALSDGDEVDLVPTLVGG